MADISKIKTPDGTVYDIKVSDTADSVVTFTSSDVDDGSAASWTTVAKIDSGETHKSIFAKMSQMFKNVRYLYKVLGTTDISSLGDGTVTDAVKAIANRTKPTDTVSQISNGLTLRYRVVSGIVLFHLSGTPTDTTKNTSFTVPSAMIGMYLVEGQWGNNAKMINVWIDSSSTYLRVRGYSNNSMNVSGCYLTNT